VVLIYDAISRHMIDKVKHFSLESCFVIFNLELHGFPFLLVGFLWPLRSATVNKAQENERGLTNEKISLVANGLRKTRASLARAVL
jgi:hypothetical protein